VLELIGLACTSADDVLELFGLALEARQAPSVDDAALSVAADDDGIFRAAPVASARGSGRDVLVG
jgi:hypothetical protein